MTRNKALEWIHSTNGKIFAVRFTKRTTGEQREMICRLGVKSHLKGGSPAYDREAHKLICVFDMNKNDYRSIPTDGITEVKVDGRWETIN